MNKLDGENLYKCFGGGGGGGVGGDVSVNSTAVTCDML